MTRIRHGLVALVAAIALLGGPAPAALAQDTSAVAVNTQDGSTMFDFAFEVRRTMKDVVDSHNEAVAYASCEQCRTVAISFQVLLVTGSPSTVTPTNVAVAINEECTSCNTAAFAYQFVVGDPSGALRFTSDGWLRLLRLRREIGSLDVNALSNDELELRLDAAAAELQDILATELVHRPPDDDDDDHAGEEEWFGPYDGEPTPTPAATGTPERGTPTPSPTAATTPTATATATATATVTAEPTATVTVTTTPTATP